jgi:hypothetical protein
MTMMLSAQFNKKIEVIFNAFGQPQDGPQQHPPHFQTSEPTIQVERQSQPLGDIIPYKLYVQTDNGGLEVVDGRIYLEASTIHGESLSINHLRVSVDKVYDGCREILVPYPMKEGTCLAELIGTYLIWPEKLIDIVVQVNLINMN